MGKFLHAQLLYRGYKTIEAYCDNNKLVQGKSQYGAEIVSPEQAVEKFPQHKYIISNKYHASEMKEQLEELGINKKDIIIYSSGMDVHLFGAKIF